MFGFENVAKIKNRGLAIERFIQVFAHYIWACRRGCLERATLYVFDLFANQTEPPVVEGQ